MIELLIDKHKIKIPSEYKEVSVNLGIQIMSYIQKDDISHNDKIAIISTLSGLEPDIFYKMTVSTINSIYDSINFLKTTSTEISFYQTFYFNKQYYGMIDFNKLTVHEYADILFYLEEAEYPLANINKILSILFRPVIHKKQSIKNILKNRILRILFKNFIPQIFNNYKIREYSEKDLEMSEIFGQKMSMDFAIAAYQTMIKERDKINNEFPTLFAQIDKENLDQYDDPQLTKEKTKPFEQIWGIYHVVATLSNSLDERDKWYTRSIRELFTYLTYTNQRTQIENERAMAQQINT